MNTFVIFVYTFWVCNILYVLGKDIATAFVLFIYYKAGMFDKFFALVNF